MKLTRTLGLTTGQHIPPAQMQAMLEQVTRKLSGGVGFGATTDNTDQSRNIDCYIATGTGAAANVAFTVQHNLKRVPIGFIAIRLSQPTGLYDSGIAWTAATNTTMGTISLKDSVGLTVFTIIII